MRPLRRVDAPGPRRRGAGWGYDQYLDDIAWAAPAVARAHGVRLDGGEASAKDPSLLEAGITGKRSFSHMLRLVAGVAAGAATAPMSFGEGAVAVLTSTLFSIGALTPKWVAKAVQD